MYPDGDRAASITASVVEYQEGRLTLQQPCTVSFGQYAVQQLVAGTTPSGAWCAARTDSQCRLYSVNPVSLFTGMLPENEREPVGGRVTARMTARKWFSATRKVSEGTIPPKQRFDSLSLFEKKIFQGPAVEWNQRFAVPRLQLRCKVGAGRARGVTRSHGRPNDAASLLTMWQRWHRGPCLHPVAWWRLVGRLTRLRPGNRSGRLTR